MILPNNLTFQGDSLRNVSISRSSHPGVFLIKGVLKICSKFTGEMEIYSKSGYLFIGYRKCVLGDQ